MDSLLAGYMNDYFKDNFVGIPMQFYRNGELCGLCMRLWCVDSICKEPLIANRTFMIADSCQDCRGNNIVTSARGLQDLAGVNYNDNPSIQVAWEFVQCDEYIEGGIKLWPSDNNSPVFLGINLSNTKELIGAVRINNMELQRTNYGFWVIDSPGKEIPLRPPVSNVIFVGFSDVGSCFVLSFSLFENYFVSLVNRKLTNYCILLHRYHILL